MFVLMLVTAVPDGEVSSLSRLDIGEALQYLQPRHKKDIRLCRVVVFCLSDHNYWLGAELLPNHGV